MLLTSGDWTHSPDYLVLHRDGTQTLIDVKPAARVEEFRVQFERTANVCKAVGWGYRVTSELAPQPATTLEYLGGFRSPHYGVPPEPLGLMQEQVTS